MVNLGSMLGIPCLLGFQQMYYNSEQKQPVFLWRQYLTVCLSNVVEKQQAEHIFQAAPFLFIYFFAVFFAGVLVQLV